MKVVGACLLAVLGGNQNPSVHGIKTILGSETGLKAFEIGYEYLMGRALEYPNPSVHDIDTILASVGIEAEDERIELLLSQVEGKDLAELIACGREKMASMPIGGAVAGGVGSLAPTIAAAAPVAADSKKEVQEDVEKSDEDIGLSLFDEM